MDSKKFDRPRHDLAKTYLLGNFRHRSKICDNCQILSIKVLALSLKMDDQEDFNDTTHGHIRVFQVGIFLLWILTRMSLKQE